MADRNLLDYLPAVVNETKEMQAVMNTEQPELDIIWTSADSVLNDMFVMDATENGVKRWERILKITPKATESLHNRKIRIVARFNEKIPYTFKMLFQMLNALVVPSENVAPFGSKTITKGADYYVLNGFNYTVELEYTIYNIRFTLFDAAFSEMDIIFDFLKRVIPANLTMGMMSRIEVPVSHLYVGNNLEIGSKQIIKAAVMDRKIISNIYSGAVVQNSGRTLIKTVLTEEQNEWFMAM